MPRGSKSSVISDSARIGATLTAVIFGAISMIVCLAKDEGLIVTIFVVMAIAAVGAAVGFVIGAIVGIARLADETLKRRGGSGSQKAAGRSFTTNVARDSHAEVRVRVSITGPGGQSRTGSAPLKWIPPGEEIMIAGHRIKCGLIYVCNDAPKTDEASAIWTNLPVGTKGRSDSEEIGYYPRYSELSRDQRADYLAWLASGRQTGDHSKVGTTHAFLCFYGLERHILADAGANTSEAIQEISRLLIDIGEQSRSIRTYFSALLHFWGWTLGAERYANLWPQLLKLQNCVLGEQEIAMVLANLVQANQPLPSDLAMEVASRDPRTRSSVVVKRAPEEFQRLFHTKYREKWPDGMNLKIAKRPRQIGYRPASPTLSWDLRQQFKSEMAIPNVLGISSQFKPLVTIWNECIDELSAYSRARRRDEGDEVSLQSYLALPEALRGQTAHPFQDQWNAILEESESEMGSILVQVGRIAQLLSITERERLTEKQSQEVAELVRSLGYTAVPDASIGAPPHCWSQEIGIFRSPEGISMEISPSYHAASAMLHLAMLVAGADGVVQDEELDQIRNFMGNAFALSDGEQLRFAALERVLARAPMASSRILSRITKRVPTEQRGVIGKLLVIVAAADEIITQDEMKVLRRIFRTLEIPPETLEALLSELSAEAPEVTIRPAGQPRRGEAIPAAPASQRPEATRAFRLDMERVAEISEETTEVISILATVMAEEEEQQRSVTKARMISDGSPYSEGEVYVSVSRGLSGGDDFPLWMEGLGDEFRPILMHLVARPSWPRADFEALASEFDLMPLGILDAVNAWADEALDDFLLDGDDPITVRAELIPEE